MRGQVGRAGRVWETLALGCCSTVSQRWPRFTWLPGAGRHGNPCCLQANPHDCTTARFGSARMQAGCRRYWGLAPGAPA